MTFVEILDMLHATLRTTGVWLLSLYIWPLQRSMSPLSCSPSASGFFGEFSSCSDDGLLSGLPGTTVIDQGVIQIGLFDKDVFLQISWRILMNSWGRLREWANI